MEATLIGWFVALGGVLMDVSAMKPVARGVLEPVEGGMPFEWVMDVEEREDGQEKLFEERYLNHDKELVVMEKTRMRGDRFLSSESHHLQEGTEASITVEDEIVHFRFKKDGVEKRNQERLTPNFVTQASMLPYLKRHWNTLKEGETIPVRFAVAERAETIGFNFKKKSMLPSGDLEVRMSPSFFLISLFAPSFEFTFTPDGTFLKSFRGIGLPRTGHPGAWKLTHYKATYQKLW